MAEEVPFHSPKPKGCLQIDDVTRPLLGARGGGGPSLFPVELKIVWLARHAGVTQVTKPSYEALGPSSVHFVLT
jgi:hypothetical protein